MPHQIIFKTHRKICLKQGNQLSKFELDKLKTEGKTIIAERGEYLKYIVLTGSRLQNSIEK